MSQSINNKELEESLLKMINKNMTDMAEPLIKKAIKDIELEMRKSLAANLIALLSRDIVMDRMGQDIKIMVKHVYESAQNEPR